MAKVTAEWLLRWRYPALLLCLALVAWSASGLRFITFSTDYRVFFSPQNPQLQAFEQLQNIYTKTDNVLFVLAPADGNVFTARTLAAVEYLTERAWQLPYSIRVDSLSNFQHTYAEGDDLIVEDLVSGAESLSQAEVARIRDIALNEPLLVDMLVSQRGHVTGVNVTVQLKGEHLGEEVPETAAMARQLTADLTERYPEVSVYLTGMIMMNNAFSEYAAKDMQTLVPVMFGVLILALLLLLRSFTATLGTVLVIAFTILTAMGLAGWLGITMTPPSSAAPTMIMTLAVAHSVHILVNFLHAMGRGQEKRPAMLESLRINLQPVFLTSLTTAIGFLSMNFSDAPPFRDLGNIVAMGVVAGFVYSVLFLPGLMLLLPVRVRGQGAAGHQAMEGLADFVVNRRRRLLWIMGLITLGLVSMIPRNQLNDQFVNYFDPSVDFRRDTDFATEHLTGIYRVDYSLASGESGGIGRPEFLERVEAFANWFRSQPEVIHVNSLTDIMKRLNQNLHEDDPGWYRLPERRDLAAQYLLLYEMSLPYGLDLNNQINVDKSATRLNVVLQSLTTKELLALEARAQSWLREHAPEPMHNEGASPSMMFAHIGARNIRSMLGGTTLALVLISLILVVALRSVKVGLISMIPNLVPAGMAFGLWGLLVGQVGLALSVVTGMTLGIVVDDTVHFLSKYLRGRREEGLNSQDAVRYAFAHVGTALWVTSAVLVAGFLVLAQSAFELNAGMGLLTAITIALALVADFLLLPPLLMKLEERSDATTLAVRPADSAAA
jgi:predicted RND superfamily exporter protein